jgi:hypothetical protein
MSFYRRLLTIFGTDVAVGGGAAFSPLSLSPLGFWLSRPQYLRQSSDGTGAVTEDGDPVGWREDLSGNGHHLTQATDELRWVYHTDGTSHWIVPGAAGAFLANADISIADGLDCFVALRQVSWSDITFIEKAIDPANGYMYQGNSTPNIVITNTGGANTVTIAATVGVDVVHTSRRGTSARAAIDNGDYVTGNTGAGTRTGLQIGFNSDGNAADVRDYGRMVSSTALADADIVSVRAYLAAEQGRVL